MVDSTTGGIMWVEVQLLKLIPIQNKVYPHWRYLHTYIHSPPIKAGIFIGEIFFDIFYKPLNICFFSLTFSSTEHFSGYYYTPGKESLIHIYFILRKVNTFCTIIPHFPGYDSRKVKNSKNTIFLFPGYETQKVVTLQVSNPGKGVIFLGVWNAVSRYSLTLFQTLES